VLTKVIALSAKKVVVIVNKLIFIVNNTTACITFNSDYVCLHIMLEELYSERSRFEYWQDNFMATHMCKNQTFVTLTCKRPGPNTHVVCWFVTALQGAPWVGSRSCHDWVQYYLPVSKGTCFYQRSCWSQGALTWTHVFFETIQVCAA
jgi:hypothetical protein